MLLTQQNSARQEKVKPLCPVFRQCGGCQYQDLSYKEELHIKESSIKEIFLSKFSELDSAVFQGIEPSPEPYHYRNRLDIQLRRTKSEGVIMGFAPAQQGGLKVLPVDSCVIARREISDFLPQLKKEGEERLPPVYRMASLVVRTDDSGKVRWGGIGKRSLRMPEEDYFSVEIEDRKIFYSLDTFFQANLSILPRVMKRIKALNLFDSETAFFDLYGGVGLFGIGFYNSVRKVVLIEENIHACTLARYNRDYHQLTSFDVHAGRVENMLLDVLEKETSSRKIGMIDPPRNGLADAAREHLSRTKEFDAFLYLSCHPESLVRDLDEFLKQGWRLTTVIPFDFFPKTKHIETLAVLTPGAGRQN